MLKAVFLDGSDSRAVRGALYEGASIAAVHGTIYNDSTASCGNHGATPSFGTRVPGSLGGFFNLPTGPAPGPTLNILCGFLLITWPGGP
jgi:hypothetical protein